jgi:hypothetical protein
MMKSKFFMLCCVILITSVLMISGCISSLNNSKNESIQNGSAPLFTALRSNDTSVMVMLIDLNGANSTTGLHVDSPAISNPDIIPAGTDVKAGKEIKITDANLSGKVNLVISSTVDGTSKVVLNGTI